MQNPAELRPVGTASDIEAAARLAREIWFEHYGPIIGPAQVEYMLARFQSAEAIRDQIGKGFVYRLALLSGAPEGYAAAVSEASAGTMLLSKLYVRKSARGRGLGRALLAWAEEAARAAGLARIRLVVNKQNLVSIAWYEWQGFVRTGPVLCDIGGGFAMDDWGMEKPLP